MGKGRNKKDDAHGDRGAKKERAQQNKEKDEELLQWLKRRQQEPLYVGSDEHEGMSLCYVNPAITQDEEEGEASQDDAPPAVPNEKQMTSTQGEK